MTFTFNSPRKLEADEISPWNNLLGKAMASYNAMTDTQYKEPNLREALLKSQLYNQYYGGKESTMALQGAQAGHARSLTQGQNISNQFAPEKFRQQAQARRFGLENPGFNSPGITGQIARYQYMKQHGLLPEMGSNNQGVEGQSFVPSINGGQQQPPSQEPQQDPMLQAILRTGGLQKQFAPSAFGKLLQEQGLAKTGINPYTGIPFGSKKEQDEMLQAFTEKINRTKPGQHAIYDPQTQEEIGFRREITPKEAEVIKGRTIYDDIYPLIRQGTNDFSGKNSIVNLDKWANEYGKNPTATKKIDDLLLADKLLSAGVVNEAATLGAGKQLQVFNSLKKSLSSMDVPEKIKNMELGLKIPSEAFAKAGQRAQEVIDSSTKHADESVPATKIVYHHPEKYQKSEKEKQASLAEHSETITVRNKKTGKEETISIAEARKRGIPNV